MPGTQDDLSVTIRKTVQATEKMLATLAKNPHLVRCVLVTVPAIAAATVINQYQVVKNEREQRAHEVTVLDKTHTNEHDQRAHETNLLEINIQDRREQRAHETKLLDMNIQDRKEQQAYDKPRSWLNFKST